MTWQEIHELAHQLASDAKRDPGCAYPRCYVLVSRALPDGDYVMVQWPTQHAR
jgi:hypothetical protein